MSVPPIFAASARSFSATMRLACASSRHASRANVGAMGRYSGDDTGPQPVTSKPTGGGAVWLKPRVADLSLNLATITWVRGSPNRQNSQLIGLDILTGLPPRVG